MYRGRVPSADKRGIPGTSYHFRPSQPPRIEATGPACMVVQGRILELTVALTTWKTRQRCS